MKPSASSSGNSSAASCRAGGGTRACPHRGRARPRPRGAECRELRVRELDARARVAVVVAALRCRRRELGVQPVGGFTDALGLRRVDGHEHHLEGRDRLRPDDAARIVVLLDGGGNDARHTDAVAAHVQRDRLAGFVEHRGLHGLAVLAGRAGRCGPPRCRARCAACPCRGAGVAGDDVAEVRTACGSGRSRPQFTPV